MVAPHRSAGTQGLGKAAGVGVVAGQDARKFEPSALGPIRAPDPRNQCGLSLLSTSRPPEPDWKFSFLTLPQDLCLTLPGLTVSLSPPSAWGPALGTCIVAGTWDLDRWEHVNITCNWIGRGWGGRLRSMPEGSRGWSWPQTGLLVSAPRRGTLLAVHWRKAVWAWPGPERPTRMKLVLLHSGAWVEPRCLAPPSSPIWPSCGGQGPQTGSTRLPLGRVPDPQTRSLHQGWAGTSGYTEPSWYSTDMSHAYDVGGPDTLGNAPCSPIHLFFTHLRFSMCLLL